MKNRQKIVIAVVGLIVVGVAAYVQVNRAAESKVRRIRGTVVSVDPLARRATIEFVHPRSGKTIRVTGEAAPNCDVRIGERSASMDEVRVGDSVVVEGAMRAGVVTATSVQIERASQAAETTSASQPTHAAP
ncbi:MAG: hypothetical protein U1D55_09355 [Phycisphaerae bacterium]